MAGLKYMATGETRGCEDAGNGETTRVMTVWALMAKNVSAHFLHVDVIGSKSFGEDAVIHVTIGIYEEENILSRGLPLLELKCQVVNKYGSRASVVPNAAEVATVLVVDRAPTLLFAPLRGFGVAREVCADNSGRY
jgi:hypothetical protein